MSALAAIELMAGDPASALETIETAEDTYNEAMREGGEMRGWRASIRAEALAGVGRLDEALALAEELVESTREHRQNWSLPLSLRALAKARAAAGIDGVDEALDEAISIATSTGCHAQVTSMEEARETLSATG